HLIPPQIAQESYRENQSQQRVFTQSAPVATDLGARRLTPLRATSLHMQCSKRGCIRPRIYSITSSAIASTPGGMVRPSVWAVLRLMTNSNLVGCATGKSAGFAPFRILAA